MQLKTNEALSFMSPAEQAGHYEIHSYYWHNEANKLPFEDETKRELYEVFHKSRAMKDSILFDVPYEQAYEANTHLIPVLLLHEQIDEERRWPDEAETAVFLSAISTYYSLLLSDKECYDLVTIDICANLELERWFAHSVRDRDRLFVATRDQYNLIFGIDIPGHIISLFIDSTIEHDRAERHERTGSPKIVIDWHWRECEKLMIEHFTKLMGLTRNDEIQI